MSAVSAMWARLTAALEFRPKLVAAVTLAIGAIPAAYMAWDVSRYAVNVPLQDDWEMAPLIVKAHTTGLPWREIFAQQQEARTVIPKLIFIASTWRGEWDVRDQIMLSPIFCALTAIGMYFLIRRARLSFLATALCFWSAVLLMFSPQQFELWLLASGFPSFIPALCLVAALLTLGSGWSTAAKFLSCAILALVSTFTLAHGLLAWALTFPIYATMQRPPRWGRWLGAWLLLTAVVAIAYFPGYAKPGEVPPFAPAVPLSHYLEFFLAFLSGGFAFASADHAFRLALVVGAALLTLFAAAIAHAVSRRHDRALLQRMTPPSILGLYSIGSGFLATLGRVGFGSKYALASRYVTFSLYLTVAVVILLAIVASDVFAQGRSRAMRFVIPIGYAALAVVAASVFYGAFVRCNKIMRATSARNRLAKSALLFSRVVDTSDVIRRVSYQEASVAIGRAAELDKLGLLRPRLIKSRQVNDIPRGKAGSAIGQYEAVVPLDAERSRASGWALMHDAGNSLADAVVLAYQTSPAQPSMIFAISDERLPRPDVKRHGRDKRASWCGWSASFPQNAVPGGATVSAWALDADAPTLYPLETQPEH